MATKSRLKMLQDRDAAITSQMRKMSDALAAEDRTAFTEDEEATFGQLQAESAAVQKSLSVENDILAQEKRLSEVADINRRASENAVAEGDRALSGNPAAGLPNMKLNYNLRHIKRLDGETVAEQNERAYKSGRFLMAIASPDEGIRASSRLWCQQHGVAFLAQAGNVNSAGGVLIPDVLSNDIIRLIESYGVFRQFAKTFPMSSDNLTVPRRTSGVTAYFVSDGVSTTESQKGWDGVTLVAKEIAALVRYPNTLADDAIINVADDLAFEIAYAMAKLEDQCGFIGDGSSTYGGITGVVNKAGNVASNASVYTAAAGHTAFSTLTLADFEGMVGALPQYASENACWFFSRVGFASSAQRLMDAGGGNTNESLATGGMGSLNKQDPFGKPYRTFLGFPVVISQVLNSTTGAQAATTGLAILGDLRLSTAMGVRKDISIDASPHRYFEFRQIGIQGVERIDIVNHDCGSATTAGPVVVLATP